VLKARHLGPGKHRAAELAAPPGEVCLAAPWDGAMAPLLFGLHVFTPASLTLVDPATLQQREAKQCLMPVGGRRGWGLPMQSQGERGADCWDQKAALIYLPFCLYTASELPAFHSELSLVCSPSSCGIPNISLC